MFLLRIACGGDRGDQSKRWTFDPAGPFSASLEGSSGGNSRKCHCTHSKEGGQLSVDS